MKILIIGSGGREHTLAHTFQRQQHSSYCLPGNPGTDKICLPLPEKWRGIDPNDFRALAAFAKEEHIDLTICGPEILLEKGIADIFHEEQLLFFGPDRSGSRIEYSKAWAKEFMRKYNIPTARYVICKNSHEANLAIDKYYHQWNGVVIKPSGLTGGKGVKVCSSLQEAQKAIEIIMDEKKYSHAGNEVVIEELLEGKEVSIMALCDGKSVLPLLPCQDHKRLYDGSQGPNTGGIGAYAPVPFLDSDILSCIETEIVERTVAGLNEEKIDYRGCLYFGLMLTEKGPRLLEYNCRFGDPEAQAVLPLIDSNLAELLAACASGSLQGKSIEWKPLSSCCVVMITRGYPKTCKTGFPIEGLESLENSPDIMAFLGKTKWDEHNNIITNGGRVLGVTATAESLEKATEKAYQAVRQINFQGAYYRYDIAREAIESNTPSLIQV